MEKTAEKEVLELVIYGIVRALAKGKIVPINVLEDCITVPLYESFLRHQREAETASDEAMAAREAKLEVECARWHSMFDGMLKDHKYNKGRFPFG